MGKEKTMIFKFPLSNNPQTLIKRKNRFNGHRYSLETEILDAIFIPYKKNKDSILSLLNELNWFKGLIFLMPSFNSDLNGINLELFKNTQVLFADDTDFTQFFNNFETSSHKLSVPNMFCWDLPLKRNFALYYSLKREFKKILLIDDDITGINQSTIETGSYLLSQFTSAGSFVENYPDTSIVGHLQLQQHIALKCFLSGSFLFISPNDIKSFFPNIYNEDWLFMTPMILDNTICSFGEISQKPYDPFINHNMATFQENGEIVAEGIFTLLKESAFKLRYEEAVWEEIIKSRRNELVDLLTNSNTENQVKIITNALDQNARVYPSDCVDYLYSLNKDIDAWKIFLEEISR